ncbi:MAG: phosphatidate cytidylyltransferase [Acidobacteria bacterium]|nr:phosphatidate cytidylyltransferase [Acidobacteriota bacterium]
MTRLLSGVVMAAAALAAILLFPPLVLRLLASVVALAAAREYLHVLHRDGRAPRALPVLLLVALTCWWMGAPTRPDVLAILLAGLAWLAIEVVFCGLTVDRAAARFLAPWYIGMPLGMLAAVHETSGRLATLLLIATIVVSDSSQYYAGRLFGRRALAPTISPKKTVEGAIGGALLATLFLALAGRYVLPAAGVVPLALVGFVMAALGICGDLFESRLKRIAGVKDSAALIPGHGGLLDRIDALLFATPAFYLYVERFAAGGS